MVVDSRHVTWASSREARASIGQRLAGSGEACAPPPMGVSRKVTTMQQRDLLSPASFETRRIMRYDGHEISFYYVTMGLCSLLDINARWLLEPPHRLMRAMMAELITICGWSDGEASMPVS